MGDFQAVARSNEQPKHMESGSFSFGFLAVPLVFFPLMLFESQVLLTSRGYP